MENDALVCLSTAENAEQAATIARALVEESLAACVNIVPGARSIYRWQGKIEDSVELLLVIKTRRPLLEKVIERVRALHSYAVPEVVALEITGGNPDYLAWLTESTTRAR